MQLKDQALQKAVDAAIKKWGSEAIVSFDDRDIEPHPAISTKALTLDMALGIGGFPKGRISLLLGNPGCLSGETELFYKRGNRPGSRKITIEKLYKRFNGIHIDGKGGNKKWLDLSLPTYLHSMDEDGRIFYNRIVAVFDSGVKNIIEIKFNDESYLRLTPDHPIATPDGFIEADSLSIGDTVLAKGSMLPRYNGGKCSFVDRPNRIIVNLKYHPYGAKKEVGEYQYTRVQRSRLVLEALLNNTPYEEYIHALKHNKSLSNSFRYLPTDVVVHHIDENPMNDDPTNLLVMSNEEHSKLHGKYENFNPEYLREVHVVSIKEDGEEHTYDIQMEPPANNFVANGIVVHNTGKSTLAMSTCIEAQKQEPEKSILFIDTEHELDLFYFESIGLDLGNAIISQPDSAEEAFDIAATILRSGRVSVMVLDSIAALKTKEDLEKSSDENPSMANVARVMSRELPRIKAIANRTGTCILMTNQWRTGFGGAFSFQANPGGKAQHYYASVIVDLEAEKIKPSEDAPTSLKIQAKINKNKVGVPYKIAKFDIEFGKGIVEESCIFEAAIVAGVMKKSGAWCDWNGKKYQRTPFIEELKEDKELKDKLVKEIKDSMKPVIENFDPETGEILEEIPEEVKEFFESFSEEEDTRSDEEDFGL